MIENKGDGMITFRQTFKRTKIGYMGIITILENGKVRRSVSSRINRVYIKDAKNDCADMIFDFCEHNRLNY